MMQLLKSNAVIEFNIYDMINLFVSIYCEFTMHQDTPYTEVNEIHSLPSRS